MGNRIFWGVLISVWLIAAFFLVTKADSGPEATTTEETIFTVPEPETEETAAGTEEVVMETEAETAPEEIPAAFSEPAPSVILTPIAKIPLLPPGTEGISFRGTVVLVTETEMVVQDATGGICLTRPQVASLSTGDILLITGNQASPFAITELLAEGTGSLPLQDTSLAQAPQNVRIRIPDAAVSSGMLTQGDHSLPILGADGISGDADVCGVILNGIFHADSIHLHQKPTEPEPEPEEVWDWKICFGLLHAHTAVSDGTGTVSEAFLQAASVEGLDFFAVTDHSDSFDHANDGSICANGSAISVQWAEGKQAAAAATCENFVGIFGYEMSWGEDKALGHIGTFRTPGWQAATQPDFGTLSAYYQALASVPGIIGQFNHPSAAYGEFRGFRDYDPAYDEAMQLLEIEGEKGRSYYSQYIRALDAGWHVAPTVGQNNHNGNFGTAGRSRTGVLASRLTEEDLYEALKNRRVYATQDPDLHIDYRLNGHIMGSIMGVSDSLEVRLQLKDATDGPSGTVEVLSTGGRILAVHSVDDEVTVFSVPTGYPYYFLRISQPDGDVAVTAPVWVDDFSDMGIAAFTADTQTPLAGQGVTLTLELFNRETIPFQIASATLTRDGQQVGTFLSAGEGTYRLCFLWPGAGEVRLSAVVRGTVNGESRQYQKSLTLHFQSSDAIPSTIVGIRSGEIGQVYKAEGYATSGNTNPYTTFPDTIYLQDSTGGIPVVGDFPKTIQIGAPLEITGVLRERDGERYLDLVHWALPRKAMYRFTCPTLSCQDAMDYSRRGGSLIQVEGTVVEKTASGQSVSRFTLRDCRGDTAVVVIDPQIRSGAYGDNRLALQVMEGKTVRAIGLLHREASGEIVLRVRNCDEVIYVPPIPDSTNPKTGDPFRALFGNFRRRTG